MYKTDIAKFLLKVLHFTFFSVAISIYLVFHI